MRVGDHERGERVQPHAPQLAIDARFGRPGVDEHRALRRLEEDPVALPDVEERDAEARRRRPRRGWMQGPPAERRERHERDAR